MLPKRSHLLLALLLLAPLRAWGVASEWAENEQSRVRLVTPYQVAPRSGELRLGLHFTLSPGWHVYWKNSGDAGFPPVVVFTPAPGLGEPELLWPAPTRFELPGDLVAFGYGDEVVYPLKATVQTDADRLRLEADVDYLVCEVDCIPYRYKLAVDQPLGDAAAADPGTAPLIDLWWSRVPTPAGQVAGVTADAALDLSRPGAPALEVRVRGVRPGETAGLFLESHEAFDTGRPAVREEDGGTVFRVPLKPRQEGKLPATTQVAWTATGLLRDGEALNLEARGEVGAGEAAPAAAPASRASRWPGPAVIALLAVASALLALWLWGLLAPARAGSHGLREALGFGAAALTVGLLYALSRQIRPEGLAAVELAILAMGLCAWLRSRSGDRRTLRVALAVILAACALAAPWMAERHRLPETTFTTEA